MSIHFWLDFAALAERSELGEDVARSAASCAGAEKASQDSLPGGLPLHPGTGQR